MTRTLSRWQATLLGLVILAGLGVGAYALFAIDASRGLGSDSIRVSAALPDVGGVEVGTRLRIQGIDAGEVEAIIPPARPGDDATIQLRVKGELRHLVTRDARVQVASDNLFYGKIVRILPGAPDADTIEDGGQLASAESEEATASLMRTVAKMSSILDDVEGVMSDVRKGQGTVGNLSRDLAEATAKMNRVAGRVDIVLAEVESGKGNLGLLLKDEKLYRDLTGTMTEMRLVMEGLRRGEGSLGQLAKSAELYNEAMASLNDMRRMVSSVKQNSDAIKSLPVVRSYVVDAHKILVRPASRRYLKWYPADDLFEPGRAVLTDTGRRNLDQAASFFEEHKEAGSEVVVASFASPRQDGEIAKTLTEKQSEVVAEYLKSKHRIHRMGFWWWSNREVRSLGVGNNPPALPASAGLPDSRIELLVFVPEA